MAIHVRFEQKKLLMTRTVFEFGDEALTYFITGETQEVKFSALYKEINMEKSMERFVEKTFYYLGIAILVALFGSIWVVAVPASKTFITNLYGIISLLTMGLLIYGKRYVRLDATKLAVPSGNKILILQDEQHQTILDEIQKRRKEQIRHMTAEVDILNHPDEELNKFLWLKQHDYITPDEFTEARQKIMAATKLPSTLF